MTTERESVIIPLERDIRELLKLDTFQGMSDAEIEKVIQYRIERALVSDEQAARNEAIHAAMQEQQETYSEIARQAKAVLKSRMETKIPWVRVGRDGKVVQNG